MCVAQTPLLWTEPRNRKQRKWKTSLNLQFQRKTMTTQLQVPTGERSVSTALTLEYDPASWLPDLYLQEPKQPGGGRHTHVRWSRQLHPSRDRSSGGRKLKASEPPPSWTKNWRGWPLCDARQRSSFSYSTRFVIVDVLNIVYDDDLQPRGPIAETAYRCNSLWSWATSTSPFSGFLLIRSSDILDYPPALFFHLMNTSVLHATCIWNDHIFSTSDFEEIEPRCFQVCPTLCCTCWFHFSFIKVLIHWQMPLACLALWGHLYFLKCPFLV